MKKIEPEYIASLFVKRKQDSHKGDYGHALLIAGSLGMGGSAVLASGAVLRSGAGLLTTHIPKKLYEIVQISVPEAMCSIDPSEDHFSKAPVVEKYSAVGAGPGLGLAPETVTAVKDLLDMKPGKLILDADALNILAINPKLMGLLPANTIITPHPGEFDRIAGLHKSRKERIESQKKLSEKYGIIVVLKGANSTISLPGGELWENTTGNPGMATAGSGDVLTGVILGLLAQNYSPRLAALIGVYIHGMAGDIAMEKFGETSMTAGNIRDSLPYAFLSLR
ncbi:MAG TPA: NAD(P)H-hydrate dehydratase [Bacteroidales bacterium]|nr:NAD(P)H-hydrate dehydratase [Bacteroidales bacterium]